MPAKKKTAPNRDQYNLDYSSTLNDAYVQITQAVRRTLQKDLAARELLKWICRIETERSGLLRDYDELAEELMCHRATAIRLVAKLLDLGLIRYRQQITADGDARKNEYRLCWERIREINTNAISREFGVKITVANCDSTVANCDYPVAPCDGVVAQCDFSIGIPALLPCSSGMNEEGRGAVKEDSGGTRPIATSPALDWQIARSALRALGLRERDRVILDAKSRGVTPTLLAEAANFCRTRGLWEPGALFCWVRWYEPGVPIDDLSSWPTPTRASKAGSGIGTPPDLETQALLYAKRRRRQKVPDDTILTELAERNLPQILPATLPQGV